MAERNTASPNHYVPNTDIITEVANAVGSRGLVYPVIGSISGRVHSLQSIDDLTEAADKVHEYSQAHGSMQF